MEPVFVFGFIVSIFFFFLQCIIACIMKLFITDLPLQLINVLKKIETHPIKMSVRVSCHHHGSISALYCHLV